MNRTEHDAKHLPTGAGLQRRTPAKEETMRRVLVLVSTVVAVGVAGFAGSASAATGSAPGTGYTGACNMLLAGAGMVNAMSQDNGQGNVGMYRAVAVSGC
jgi:hypothetical protein